MTSLLPSQSRWVESVSLELLDGQVVMLRGLPSTGKTILGEAVHASLGPSALMLHGRSLGAGSWEEVQSHIREQLIGLVEQHGCAQLIIDDYPHALRWDFGVRLQRLLLYTLVDGPHARDIGALVIGRWARAIHITARGSPLITRTSAVTLPAPDELDFASLGITDEEAAMVSREVGNNCALLTKVRRLNGALDFGVVRECLDHLSAQYVADLPWEAVIELRQSETIDNTRLRTTLSLEALLPLLQRRPDGQLALIAGLVGDPFQHHLHERSPTWPRHAESSQERFVDLLSGVEDAAWIDRYLAADPPRLLTFLQGIRSKSTTRIRLLLSSSVCSEAIRRHSDVMWQIAALDGVEVRSMSRDYFGLLHERQLVYLGDAEGGAVLPTVDVILGAVLPGSAMAVRAPFMPRNLVEEAWERALPADRWVPARPAPPA